MLQEVSAGCSKVAQGARPLPPASTSADAPCVWEPVTCSTLRKDRSEVSLGIGDMLGPEWQPDPNLAFSAVAAVCLSLSGCHRENLSSRGSTHPFLSPDTDHQAVPCSSSFGE